VPARNRLVVLLDDDELEQVDTYVAKNGLDRSFWVRFGLAAIGALKRARGKRSGRQRKSGR
jgi:hypothetical protein